jgi:2-C-methyl-D-erythritol 4-phosphate cytidylyltransferase/2-C-methyl-D-erythritol 2,4-cyclodiphosphate synthase
MQRVTPKPTPPMPAPPEPTAAEQGARRERPQANPAPRPEAVPALPEAVRAAVVVAGAGASRRMGAPKLLMPLAGRPVLTRTLQAIRAFAPDAQVVVAIQPDMASAIREQALVPYGLQDAVELVPGGDERQRSVAAAVQAVSRSFPLVVIHDGARPLATPALFARVCQEALVAGGATAALPARETLHRVDGAGLILETPPRASVWAAQTPQAFNADLLREVHRWAERSPVAATDDAALFAAAGHAVRVVEGEPGNIKITFPEDLAMADAIIRQRESGRHDDGRDTRVGMGWDVHRLEPGLPLVIGGVAIQYELGLAGHSDADVLTHAVMDAVLGAAALRDIGVHFPPNDPAYAGADSIKLLGHVAGLVRDRGWIVNNIDAMIVAERPKLAPHYPEMCRRLAQALGIPEGCVNVKASTSEGMGFTGRSEGIAAYAVALLERRVGS